MNRITFSIQNLCLWTLKKADTLALHHPEHIYGGQNIAKKHIKEIPYLLSPQRCNRIKEASGIPEGSYRR
jgi:hypothetical protein